MASKRRPISYPELDEIKPKGRGAILRSAQEVAAEQALLENQITGEPENQELGKTDTQKYEIQENQISGYQEKRKGGKPVTQQTSELETQLTRKPESQKSGNRASYPKVTYRLSVEAIDAVEDMKRILRRQYGVKVNLEEIAEEAILAAYQDLLKNQENSNLVNKLSGKPVIRK